MEYRQLRNYGQINTAKLTAHALMVSITSIPKELGIIGTPKFAAKMASKERYWRKRDFKTAQQRGLVHEDFIQGMKYALSFYSALVSSCGRDKELTVYPKLAERIGVAQWEDFLPSSEDFLSFPDDWEAVRQYWRAYFQAYEHERGMRYEIVRDTDSEFQVSVTECAWDFIWREDGGYPELAPMSGHTDVLYLPKLMAALGGDFKRESWLCRGDATCDWHFFRERTSP